MSDMTDDDLHNIADPWHAIAEVGGSMRTLAAALARELLERRQAEQARYIETDAELHAVARGVVVRAKDGTIACRYDAGLGVVFGYGAPFPWAELHAPAEILFDPQEARRG